MAQYGYVKQPVRLDALQGEIAAAGVPVDYLTAAGADVTVYTPRALTPAEKTTLDGAVAAHDGRPRRPRPLWSIRGDVQALSVGQFGNVWNDLSAAVSGGPPRKYLADYGTNAGTIFVYDHVIYVVQGTAAQIKAGQISLTACYVQDNPAYLVHPPFDSSINVDGSEPVP